MALWSSKDPDTPSAKWKLLAASVLAAALISLLCGLCVLSTSRICTNILTAIVSSLSLTDQQKNAQTNNSKIITTYPTTTLSTISIFGTSSNGYVNTSINKLFAISTVGNMATKISGPTITHVCSTSNSTMYSCTNSNKASPLTNPEHFKNYGPMGSAQSANSILKPLLIRAATYSRKLQGLKQSKCTSEATNMASLTGSNHLTSRCL